MSGCHTILVEPMQRTVTVEPMQRTIRVTCPTIIVPEGGYLIYQDGDRILMQDGVDLLIVQAT